MSGQLRRLRVPVLSRRRGAIFAAALALPVAALTAVLAVPASSLAQVVGTPISVGEISELPQAVAVDPATGVVFAGNPQDGTVVAVSEASQSVAADLSLGGAGYVPSALAADPVSGTVYVTELYPPQVAVITEDPADPADDQVTGTVTVPPDTEGFDGPDGIAVLPGSSPDTGTVYVSNGAGDTVSVVSEATNTVTSVIPIPAENGSDDSYPDGITADPATGLVYVADQGDGDVSVISGSTLLGSFPLQAANPTYLDPSAIAADPDTGTVYVTVPAPAPTYTSAKVYVIQEDTASPADASVVAAVPLPAAGYSGAPYGVPEAVAVDPAAASVYVTNYEGTLDVINEDTADPGADTVDDAIALEPGNQDFGEVYAMAVDTSTGNAWSGTAYAVSDQTQDLYPVAFPPALQSQSISFTAPATGTVGGSATLSATGGGSGNPVTFSVDPSSGAGVCSLSGATVSYTGAGSCVIDANQAGNASYTAAAQVQQTITVSPASQSISFTAPANGAVGGSATLTATGGGSGNPVVFSVDSSSGAGVCSVSGDTVSYTGAGSCVIDANQAGNANYSAAPQVQQTITVSPVQAQSISFTGPATGYAGGSATLTATGGGSGNPVVFSVDSASGTGVCSVSGIDGTTVSYLATGTCVIDANQAGNASYSAAPEVSQTITVGPGLAVTTTGLEGDTMGYPYPGDQLSATGGEAPYTWSLQSGALPAGLTLSSDGMVSGTPEAAGTFNVTVAVTDSETPAVTATAALSLTIGLETSATLPLAYTGEAYTGSLTAAGGVPPYTWTLFDRASFQGLPPGLTLSSDGTITGTPTTTGTYEFTATVTDSQGDQGDIGQTMTVMPGLVVTSTGFAGTVGTALPASPSYELAATGGAAPYTWTAQGLPPGLTVSPAGVVSGTPTTAGTYAVAVTVTDSEAPAVTITATVTFTVALQAAATLPPAYTGQAYTGSLTAAGGVPPYTWTLSDVGKETGPPPGLTLSSDGTITGTPTTTGTYEFTATVTDSEGNQGDIGQTMTVMPGLVVTSTGFAGTVGTALPASPSYELAATGGEGPYAWTAQGLPPGLTLNSGDTISGTPTTAGTYAVTLAVTDSETPAVTVTATVPFTVALGASATLPPAYTGEAYTGSLTAAGGVPPYTWTLSDVGKETGPPQGLTLSSDGTITGTPTTAGTYVFTATVTDSQGSEGDIGRTMTVGPGLAYSGLINLVGRMGDAFDIALTATGGATPYTWSVTSGALPPGLSLSSGGVVSGTPTATGTFDVAVAVTDAESPPVTVAQPLTFVIDGPPAITSAGTASFAEGSAGSFTITATGIPAPAFTAGGTLPAGLTFTDNGNGTATLAGTPAAGTIGDYTIPVTATNDFGSVTQQLQLVIYQPTVFTSAAAATFTVGSAGVFTVTATGSPTPGAISEQGALPPGVSFANDGNGTASLTGTPAAGSGGSYPIALTAGNGVTPNATQAFVLTVDQAPGITSASSAAATAGAPFSFVVTASGTPTATLTRAGALPAGITFVAGPDGTATLAGIPTATAAGTYSINLTAKNSAGATSQGFTLTVDAAPAFTSAATVTETAGTAFSYAVASTGYPAATLTNGTLPAGVSFAGTGTGTGTLSGTGAIAAGTYTVKVTAASAAGSTSQTITMTVKAPGTTETVPAITSAASATATTGTAFSYTIATAASPTTYSTNVTHSGTLPAGVSFTNNGNGTATLAGTPTPATGGSYPVTLTAKDSAGATTQAFVLTLVSAPEITTAATGTATTGSPFSITVSGTGTPAPAMTEAGALPQGLTWTDNGNGTATLAGTPAGGQGGVYPLTLTAANSIGTASQTFTLTVDQPPAITSAAQATAADGTAFTFTFSSAGYPQATITRTGTVPGLTYTNNSNGTATLSGTPTKAGTYTLTITAKNSVGSTTQTFALTVS